ncbi:aminotransferase class V-fold PLP-dependent enzyme [Kordiimonas aestuarii]|uniref:aminotransferase class V-fold PLP-dependent enzyme n=1 Tax=Kordiimonas aestuarii TaxID=1005925 RepID=UPI0021D398CF|nr:aminotransferase class V-fold PLP-dependent enzyme [Kordiimonas aestuarii]
MNKDQACTRIHLNNAGASIPTARVLDSVMHHLLREVEIGGYEAAVENSQLTQSFYANAAKLINCAPEEIAFTDSATRAWNTFLYSIPFKAGDKIITTDLEFGSNVVSLQHITELHDLELVVVDTSSGSSSVSQKISALLDDRVKLIAVTHVPAHCGSVQDVQAIGEVAKGHSCLYMIDACQSVGQMNLDVKAFHCDALVATGRKWLRGPRGTGFLFVANNVAPQLDTVAVDLANTDWVYDARPGASRLEISKTAKRFEIWERNIAGQIGLATAIQHFLELDQSAAFSHVSKLREEIVSTVKNITQLDLYPETNPQSGTVTFSSDTVDLDKLKQKLMEKNINVSVMHDWDAPWDYSKKQLKALMRVSPHYFNTIEEIRAFSQALPEAVAGL